MRILIFTDLDGTLFQSARQQPPCAGWRPLAFLKNGAPVCWASPQQQAFLVWLQHGGAQLVPVTARNLDAFLRVRIDFTGSAVIDYGGAIVNAAGRPDEAWLARTREQAQTSQSALLQWQEFLQRENALLRGDANVRIIGDFGAQFYVTAKSANHNEAVVQALAARCHDALAAATLPPMVLHTNGNNLALLPHWLDKSHAVRHILECSTAGDTADDGGVLSIGLGDSLSDVPFLRACDWRMLPGGSQIDMVLGQQK